MDDQHPTERRLQAKADAASADRHQRRFRAAARLIAALRRRQFPMDEIASFLADLDRAAGESDVRSVRAVYDKLVEHLQKRHELVLPDHYKNQWMALGLSAFGLPLGVAFAIALDQTAFIGIGLPIGFAIGAGIGAQKDREAREAGRVLDVEASEGD